MMRIDKNGVFHFDAGGDVDPYFGIGSTTVIGQRLGGQNPADFIQGLLGDIGSTNVSAVGGGVGQYNPNLSELLGRDPTFEDVVDYVKATYNPETTSLTQRKTAFDELMSRYGVSVPAGAPPPESFLSTITPVYIAQPGISLPGDASSFAPVGTSPAATTPAATTPPAGNPPGILSSVTSAVKSSADSIMKAIQDMFPFWNQAQVVINPVSGKATVVFGTPPSGAPVVQAGTLPRSNTNVGVTTGVPLLDQVINDILGRSGGLNTGSIKDEIIKVIAAQAGVDAATAAAVIGGDLDQVASQVNTVLADRTANLGIDLTKDRDEDVVVSNVPGADTSVVKSGADTSVVKSGADTSVVGGNNTVVGDGKTVVKSGADTSVVGGNNTVVGDGKTVVGDGKTAVKEMPALVKKTSPVADSPTLVRAVVPDSPTLVRAVVPDSPDLVETLTQGNADGAGNNNTGAPVQQPQSTQDMYSVSTEQAGVADIGTPYDLNASLLDNIMRILAEKEAGAEGTELYGGGSVNGYNATDELIKLLRG